MPELPEVETVRKGLEKLVIGQTIQEVTILWPRIIEAPEAEIFALKLVGQRLEKMERRGKYLLFKFTDYDMISHLRMEGKYETHDSADAVDKHTHVIFKFTDGTELRYLDVRKFGRMTLVEKDQGINYKSILALGPEPVPTEFKLKPFREGLKKHHKAIKPLLLDQRLVTGLGNIYVDEALWEAQIHPEQPADSLNGKEVSKLYYAIIDVLGRAVEAGGTTIRSYLNALGEAGTFQVSLNVYGQTNQPCLKCGTPIKKIKVAQRGTHFCPKCQTLKVRS
ncbi:DNA-formamidopyrimidine glycosylase [Enterococcus sp. DIV0242_7C1]|uniref:Formamidopyrimidine-DNA glycosylase n=1 Tax=Candidatus Enterococcus dunnyi TaxID=1834192 RepID=A0A200JEM2_9ENTE|nr:MULTISPECIES: DNA-formamidopyrimidine glycosylase [unclassified Enterococcus]MBO0469405.1 DNA-formamidopyrimidine glycosylase [Enterococcus sp. DIV0242_7C1]OUZ35299.1 formamidopyrimidine-DNA glycosylase [Enterococcus sp. 9D6_DIV0238]